MNNKYLLYNETKIKEMIDSIVDSDLEIRVEERSIEMLSDSEMLKNNASDGRERGQSNDI